MSRYGVDRRVRLACVMAVAACTDPTFMSETSEAGSSARLDAQLGGENDRDGQLSDPIVDAASHAPETHAPDAITSVAGNRGQDAGDTRHDAGAVAAEAGPAGDANPASDAAPASVTDAVVLAPDSGPAQPDAGPAASIPAWAEHLLGRYAKRSMYFAYDLNTGGITVTLDTSLVTISEAAPGQLEMLSQQCFYNVYRADGGGTFTLLKPESLPPLKGWISLGPEPHFSTETVLQHMGYDPTRQSRCSANSSYATKYEDQKWLTTRCTCSAAPEVLPTAANDCRVSDPDMDEQPGVFFKGTGWASDMSAVLNTTRKISDGEVRIDREHVLREQRTRNVACLVQCPPLNEQLCPGGETLMRPLPANATCADAVNEVNPIAYPVVPERDCRAR